MKVFVTNASVSFAAALLPLLCEAAEIEAVTGMDTRPTRFQHPKFRAVRADLHDPAAASLLNGHHAFVHLAAGADATQASTPDALDLAVRSAHRFFQYAHAARVERLIHISSAAVYGPAVHANEHSPLRPLAGFGFAEQQARLEELLAIDFPHCVRLRPHVVVGPHAHPAIRRVLHQPLYPRRSEADPLFQCVHEEDLARAVMLSLQPRARGAYNIATEDSFTLRDAIRAGRGFSLGVSVKAAESVLKLAGRYVRWEVEPVWVERAAHTVLINCRRAIAELGWRTSYTATQALAAT